MLTTIIEDMEGKLISKQTYVKDYPFNNLSFKKKRRKIKFNPSFLDELDFSLGVLVPDMSHNDFLVAFLNRHLLDYYNIDLAEVKGAYLFNSLDFLNELNIRDLLFDSFNEDRDLEFKVLRYIEGILISSRIYKFFRFKNKLYFRISYSDDLDILNKSTKETIENSRLSVGILQGNKWVYGNRTFCRMNDVSLSDIGELEIFNSNIISRESASIDELKYILDDILNRKQFFFHDNIQLNYGGEIRHIAEFIYPTSFNNQPAIEVIFLDQTKEKRLKREFHDLNRKMEIILKLGKLAVCQVKEGNVFWSNEIFSILELPPDELNIPDGIGTIEEFFAIIQDYIIKTDLNDLYENIIGKKDDASKFDLKFKVRTKKGNIKHVNCEFILYGENPLTLTGFAQDVSYEESLRDELMRQLEDYEDLYGQLQKSKRELEEESLRKSDILEYVYNKLNKNLNIFIYLLESYLASKPESSDEYYDAFKKRIEILCKDNLISQNFEYFNNLSLNEFMGIFLNDYYSKLFKSSHIDLDIDENILLTQDDMNILYLILCEYFIMVLRLEERHMERFEINADMDDELIRISIRSYGNEKMESDMLKNMDFFKKLQEKGLKDLFIDDDGRSTLISIIFENAISLNSLEESGSAEEGLS